MIVVTGRVEVADQDRDRFVEVATAMCTRSRAEDGCIGYRVYADLEQPRQYVFVEEWSDDAALQRHFAQQHTTTFLRDLGVLLASRPDVLFHTVGSTRRLDRARGLVSVD